MRLAGCKDVESAQRYLEDVYIPDHNKRFAVAAREE
jgi:hypothetical protein